MTTVEFIVEQLAKNGVLHSSDIAKAKEMKKEQMINAIVEFSKEAFNIHTEAAILNITRRAKKYYNKTFKSE